MIEEKLYKALASLGFSERLIRSELIAPDTNDNSFARISPFTMVSYISYPPGEIKSAHSHPELRITFVRSGSGTLLLEGKEHPLEPGGISVIPCGVTHTLQVSDRGMLNICELVIDNSNQP